MAEKKSVSSMENYRAFVTGKRGMVLMGINVRVQKPVNKGKVILCHAKPYQDLQECLHCKYFYGNSRQCIVQDCTKKTAGVQVQEDKDSPCYGCPYKKQEGYCFPCMRRILGKNGMERGA